MSYELVFEGATQEGKLIFRCPCGRLTLLDSLVAGLYCGKSEREYTTKDFVEAMKRAINKECY